MPRLNLQTEIPVRCDAMKIAETIGSPAKITELAAYDEPEMVLQWQHDGTVRRVNFQQLFRWRIVWQPLGDLQVLDDLRSPVATVLDIGDVRSR